MPNTYWIIFSQNKLCIFQHQDQYHLPDSIEEFDLQEYTENAVLLHQDDKQVIQLLDLQHAALETVDNEHQHR